MQTVNQGMVIDPILTTFVRGYTNNEFIGLNLFPVVGVNASGGQVIEFGKEAFMLYDTQRAPGGATKRVEFGYQGRPYATSNHALEALVPDEMARDAQVVPGIDLSREAVGLTWDSILLRHEVDCANIALNPANYAASNVEALSSTALWSNSTSTPDQDVQAARAAIRAGTGKYPNVMTLPPGGIMKLNSHPIIRDRLKYTSSENLTAAMLARFFEVDEVWEGKAVSATQNGTIQDVWGNAAVLAYVPKNFRSVRAPSYGYTYRLTGFPNVKVPYRDDNRDSWVYGVRDRRAPVLPGNSAGFLIENLF